MNDTRQSENYLEILTGFVAELADQLRLSFVGAATETPLPACTARLSVLADLLTSSQLQNDLGSLVQLGNAIVSLIDAMYEGPDKDLVHLEPALEELTDALETTLGRLDAGEPAARLGGDPVWLTILSRLQSAGTPLEIMDELDACARHWEERWCKCELPPEQESQLRQRWLTFREYGDAMFAGTGAAAAPAMRSREAGEGVILLVDSILRREQLLHKLQGMGFSAQTTATPETAMSLVRSQERARAIICDNLEPSNHLIHLGRLKKGQKGRPALVLITAGSGSPTADLQRARNLGADGVWAEPFNTQPLAGIPALLVEEN